MLKQSLRYCTVGKAYLSIVAKCSSTPLFEKLRGELVVQRKLTNLDHFCHVHKNITETITSEEDAKTLIAKLEKAALDYKPPKPFEEVQSNKDAVEFLDELGPPLPVAFNLAAYVNRSETLVKLVQLGVDLSRIERNPEKAKYILQLEFEKDVKCHIQFLLDNGVDSDELGKYITNNPFIFKERIEDLEVRINYLKSKKFSETAISHMITRNPLLLSMETRKVDSRLGFFQKQFHLTGDEVRCFATKCPKLISYPFQKIMEKLFIFKEELGFSSKEMKTFLLSKPKVWMLGPKTLKERFDIVHNLMGLSHEQILKFPGVFLKRSFLLKQRHQYLAHLGRAQYDPTKPNFISLADIATTTDSAFCSICAHTSVDQYNEFLKTL
ncbi:transcription termination factor 3, mitochondrial-like [Stegodyphus dumicola]|uniref:transcription termination factor 3, mitochondrial-like n=1 Tax=Stegodyphus dumicola TaxID=202533 RepID=UPI0015B2705C|nr:transcription termination factor 3, mitochondrial-like [Stegodyphus dumicola]